MKLKLLIEKHKKIITISILCSFMFIIIGFTYYKSYQREQLKESMNITFTDLREIEYGTKDLDIKKAMVKKVQNAKIKKLPKVDTMKVGKQTLKFTLVHDGLEKEIEHKVQIKDTKAPEITLKENMIELTVNAEFNMLSNIESVKDPIDGGIKENVDALEINKKATEEYKKLKGKNINENTRIAERKLHNYLIENTKDDETTKLYLKNCFYFEGDIDTSQAGENTIKVVAVDKNGLKTEKEFKIVIKEIEQPQANSTKTGTDYVLKETLNNGVESSQNISKQSISAVVNSALEQVGTPYVWGGSTPDGFDCSGLIYWAFASNGYSIPRAVNGAGYSIGTNLANAQAGDILAYPSHSNLITSITPCGEDAGMTIYSFTYITALNGTGVVSRYSPTLVRQDGTVIQGSQEWIDIRRVR